MIPEEPNAVDDAATEPIADLPLFSSEEIGRAETPREAGEPATESRRSTETPRHQRAEQATLPVEPPHPEAGAEIRAAADATESGPAPLRIRFRAAALDALAMVAVLMVLLAGGMMLGAPTDLAALPFYLPTWCIFSLLYHVVPLLFWGRTPGMAWAGLVTRNDDGSPLAIGQAVRRWAAGLVSLILLGVPGLIGLEGRSLADRMSDSTTLAAG